MPSPYAFDPDPDDVGADQLFHLHQEMELDAESQAERARKLAAAKVVAEAERITREAAGG